MSTGQPEVAAELIEASRVYGAGDVRVAAVDRVSLVIPRGSAVALLGRSGSGKSTVLNLLGAMDAPTDGRVLIEGVPVDAMRGPERTVFRRRRLGFVFQSFHLISSLTVLENAAVPWMLDGAFDHKAKKQLTDLLGRLGLGGRAGSYPDQLSGGQRQRVAIARALTRGPSLVLADEPTGNLDLQTGDQILDLFDELRQEHGFTLVMATHARDAAARCDHRAMLEDGRVTEMSSLLAPSERPS